MSSAQQMSAQSDHGCHALVLALSDLYSIKQDKDYLVFKYVRAGFEIEVKNTTRIKEYKYNSHWENQIMKPGFKLNEYGVCEKNATQFSHL